MKERTLLNIIENYSLHGRDTAYVQQCGYRQKRWSYGQILDASRRFARELAARDIRAGDRIYIWGENCAEWIIAFLGSVLGGAVVVPMDPAASPDYARRVCRQVEARVCLCSRNMPLIGSDIPVIPFEGLAETVSRHSEEPFTSGHIRAGDPAEIVFTSGTTAEPKGVVLSHRNILANLDPLEKEIRKYLKYERFVHPLRFMNLLPLSHMFGQFMGIFLPQILGGTVLFQNTLNPSDIIRSLRRERISVLVAVPKMLETLRHKVERDLESEGRLVQFQGKLERAQNSHFLKRWWIFRRIHRKLGWKFWAFICGGATLGEETERFWGMLGFAVIQGYGLTETTSLISVNNPFKIGKGTIGKVLPGREMKLDSKGEILVRGESIAESYFEGNTYTPVSGEDGWFSTGDIGSLDDQGNLHFKGRRKT